MSNPRDTGRYDAFTDSYVDQQVRVDFAWGNVPMQPNDDREEGLDETLDSHIIATSGYQNFPGFSTGGIFDDTIANAIVPNVVGMTEAAATTALTTVGLVKGAVTTANNAAGATSGNTGKIKTQTPAAGTTVNEGASVALVKYDYVVPGYTVLAIKFDSGAMTKPYIMVLQGQTNKPSVGDRVTVSGNQESTWNRTWSVATVANDNSYTTGSTKVTMSPIGTGASEETTYQTGGLATTVPHAVPTSVTFGLHSNMMGSQADLSIFNNSDNGGRLTLVVYWDSQANSDLLYGSPSPANNGYAGKTLTFSDLVAESPSSHPMAFLAGAKTVYASEVYDAGMGSGPYGVKFVLTSTTSNGRAPMVEVRTQGTMAIS